MAEVESEEITSDSDIQLAEDNSKAVSNYDDSHHEDHRDDEQPAITAAAASYRLPDGTHLRDARPQDRRRHTPAVPRAALEPDPRPPSLAAT